MRSCRPKSRRPATTIQGSPCRSQARSSAARSPTRTRPPAKPARSRHRRTVPVRESRMFCRLGPTRVHTAEESSFSAHEVARTHVESGRLHPRSRLDPRPVPGLAGACHPSLPGSHVHVCKRVKTRPECANPRRNPTPHLRLVRRERRNGDVVLGAGRCVSRKRLRHGQRPGRRVEDRPQRPTTRSALGAHRATQDKPHRQQGDQTKLRAQEPPFIPPDEANLTLAEPRDNHPARYPGTPGQARSRPHRGTAAQRARIRAERPTVPARLSPLDRPRWHARGVAFP